MPSSARKSSLGGARNRTQKAHIPYRGDNPEVGKKTGIAVQHVERKSDGFEPFAELLQQADGRTPPRPRIRKKSAPNAARYQDDYYDEDDGEMSMQLDSPVHHLVNMRPPATPLTAGRRSSIRPVARTSEVDFDKIPSPRPSSLSTHRASKNAAPGPSSLSRSIRAQDFEPDSDSPNEDAGYDFNDDTQNMDNDFDDYAQDNTPTQASTTNRSFAQLDADDDEEDQQMSEPEPEPEPPTPKPTKKKPPAPREPSQSEEEIEAEIANGLEDVDLGPGSEDEEEEEMPPPKKKKKVETVVPEKKSPRKTQSRSKKENKPVREGVRRSQREHYAPLEYWRGEKLVYGRMANSGPVLVPQIKEIVRIPKPVAEPLGTKRKRGASARARSRSVAVGAEEDQIPPALPVPNPEEGWDDDTDPICEVISYTQQDVVNRRIAWTAKMIDPKVSADKTWSFDKVFGDDDFIAAGQLSIPPRGRKPSKASKDNTYIFYVIEGAINFKIHKTSMVLATGAMFMVPRGNTYLLENISNRTAKVFFTQARKMEPTPEERAVKAQHIAEVQRRKSLARSSSAGVPASRSAPLDPLSGRSRSLHR